MNLMSSYTRSGVSTPGVPMFRAGDRIRILSRSPVACFGMPFYLHGKTGTVEAVIERSSGDSGDDREAQRLATPAHAYRLAIPRNRPDYVGSPRDGLRIEVAEPWLVRV